MATRDLILDAVNITREQLIDAYISSVDQILNVYNSKAADKQIYLMFLVATSIILTGLVTYGILYYLCFKEAKSKSKTQKIRGRKQTGYFRPKHVSSQKESNARSPKRKDSNMPPSRTLTILGYLEIMKQIAATKVDEPNLDEEDWESDGEIPRAMIEAQNFLDHFRKVATFASNDNERGFEGEYDNGGKDVPVGFDQVLNFAVEDEMSVSITVGVNEEAEEEPKRDPEQVEGDEPAHYADGEVEIQAEEEEEGERVLNEPAEDLESVDVDEPEDDPQRNKYNEPVERSGRTTKEELEYRAHFRGHSRSPDSFSTARIRPQRSQIWHEEDQYIPNSTQRDDESNPGNLDTWEARAMNESGEGEAPQAANGKEQERRGVKEEDLTPKLSRRASQNALTVLKKYSPPRLSTEKSNVEVSEPRSSKAPDLNNGVLQFMAAFVSSGKVPHVKKRHHRGKGKKRLE